MTTDTEDRPPSTSERYLRASNTSDITVDPTKRTDADMLLAAGWAAQGNVRGTQALALWRLGKHWELECNTRNGQFFGPEGLPEFENLAVISANWIMGKCIKPGRDQLPRIQRVQARETADRVLVWWLDQTCGACEGRAHPLIPGSNRLDYSRECAECHGTGKSLVDHVVRQQMKPHARWLASEYDGMAGAIFSAMARLLAPSLDL